MTYKIELTGNTVPFKCCVHDSVDGFIRHLLDKEDNQYSDYSVSQLHGGTLDKNKIMQYYDGAYLWIRTNNEVIIEKLKSKFLNYEGLSIQTMKVKNITEEDFQLYDGYDIIRIDNLYLRDKNTHKVILQDSMNPDDYTEILRNHSIKKLKHYGVDNLELQFFDILPFHPENWKNKFIKHHNNTKIQPTSNIMIRLYGSQEVKKIIINAGFGQATGYGCGFAKVKNK